MSDCHYDAQNSYADICHRQKKAAATGRINSILCSLDGDALGEIPGLIYVAALIDCHVICK